jgi:hypothetical protein
MRLPITTHPLRNKEASSSELVNCYVEALPQDAAAPYLIRRCPGITKHSTVGVATGPTWVMKKHPSHDSVFAVHGEANDATAEWQSYDLQGVLKSRAGSVFEIEIGENFDLESNNADLIYVSQPNAWYIDVSSGLLQMTAINDANFTARGAGDVEFLDNFFLFREPGTGRFFCADVGSSSAFTSTNFATAEESPDNLVGMKSDRGQILLFGEDSAEIWDAKGGTGFPFRNMLNGVINKGCINGRTCERVDNKIFWLAEDRTVRTLNGMEAVKVSNDALDKILQADTSVRSPLTKAFTYSFDGKSYYVLRTLNNCFALDVDSGLWHRRRSLGYDTWRIASAASFHEELFVGDVLGPPSFEANPWYVGKMDLDTHDEMGYIPVMQWTYQPVWNQGQRVFHDRLEIFLETGVGGEGSADPEEPVLSLEYSDDNGDSWKIQPSREIGAYGERWRRCVWHNLGSSYNRIYRASVSDNIPVSVHDTQLTARGGPA